MRLMNNESFGFFGVGAKILGAEDMFKSPKNKEETNLKKSAKNAAKLGKHTKMRVKL